MPNLMQNSLAGQTIAPADGSSTDIPNDMSSYDDAIKKAEESLTGILNQYPNIDYQAKYADVLKGVQNRPVDKAPNPLLSFAYNLGSPQAAPGIMHQGLLRRQQQQDQKEHDMMVLKENLLQGAIQQEIAKGNFKTALSQSEKLSELQEAIGNKHRAQDMQDWKDKQNIKTKDAKTLVHERVKAVAQSFHFDEKEQLMLEGAIMHTFGAMASHPDMMGNYPDMDTLMTQYAPQIQEMAQKIIDARKGKKSVATTTPTAPSGRTGIGDVIHGMQTEGK